MLAMYGVSVAAAVIIYSSYIIILGWVPIPLVDVTDFFFVCRSFPPGRVPLFIMVMLFAMERRSPAAHKSIAGDTSRIADGKIVIEFAAVAAAAGVDEPEEEYQRGDGVFLPQFQELLLQRRRFRIPEFYSQQILTQPAVR